MMQRSLPQTLAAALFVAGMSAPVVAQERPNLMIVLDGSGSMWGQVDGRTKIELAREALSVVLSEVSPEMAIGMLAYGHRVRGQCSDIEVMVPLGPAALSVPRILDAAERMTPRGMTPLTEAVMQAAQRMGYTEQAATVVLLTDGVETCEGDPCALGRMLAEQGIDFRAHVVGFDLTDAEQQQVTCLAEATGGMFLAANDAAGLQSALAQTLAVAPAPMPEPDGEPVPEPEPVLQPRDIHLILRDVADGPVLTGRPFRVVEFRPLDGAETPAPLRLHLSPGPLTADGALLPGRYTLLLERQAERRNTIRVALPVEVPEGDGQHVIDLVIAARLQLEALRGGGEPMPERNGRLPTLRGQGWSDFEIRPVVEGAIDASADFGGINSRDVALSPGEYFVRGTLSGTVTRERLIHVEPGVTTRVTFDFAAAPVLVDLRDARGFPVDRYEVSVFDGAAEEAFVSGTGRNRTEVLPVYLTAGTWRIVAEGRNAARAEAVVTLDGSGTPVTLIMQPGQGIDQSGMAALMAEDFAPQCLDTHRDLGCVVEAVTPQAVAQHLGLDARAASLPLAPRYTGTWQTHAGLMALVQDGRRVWGEVNVNGGIGLVWGHVAPDGLVLRGAMDRSSSPRGVMELRLAPDGSTLTGRWDHAIGRMAHEVSARRLSGGVPPLSVATGSDSDLHLTQRGQPWEPASSPGFAAFMDVAQAPASADTGDDIDAMQALADLPDFTGIWTTNTWTMTLRQEGRRVWGQADQGTLEGELSLDGRTLRGTWTRANGRGGLFAFVLDDTRRSFTGESGEGRTALALGRRWNGQRVAWLIGDVPESPRLGGFEGPEFETFMSAVRGLDPATAPATSAEPAADLTLNPTPESAATALPDRSVDAPAPRKRAGPQKGHAGGLSVQNGDL